MKKLFTLFGIALCFLLLSSSSSFAQLNGTYTIPGSYATISAAVTDLNTVGISGPVIFDVAAGYTESIATQITITTTGTSTNTITFQKSGAGANPIITRTDAGSLATTTAGGYGDGIIRLDGTDYITFNGIDISASNQGIEYGYYLHKPSGTNGCQYVTIQNCVITMTKGTSGYVSGIHLSNGTVSTSSATGVTVTAASGTNAYVTITGNTIQNVHNGIYARGYNSVTYFDNNLTIGSSGAGNIIQNYGGGSATSAHGVYLIYNANINISYNTINNAGGGGSNHASTLYGIFNSTTSASGSCTYNNNSFTLGESGTSAAFCIYDNAPGTSKTVNNNTYSYGTFTSTTTTYVNYLSTSTPNVTFSGNSIVGTINKTSASGSLYFYYNLGGPTSGTETMTNNTVSNITVSGTSALYGLYSNTSVSQNRIWNNNTVSNLTAGTGAIYCIYGASTLSNQMYNNTITNINTSGTIYGLYFSGTNPTVYNNNVYGLTSSGASTIYSLYDAGTGTTNCYRNSVYNIQSGSGAVYGMYVTTGTQNNVYNNFVSDLRAPTAASAISIAGIYVSGGTAVNLFYNTVFLNATSSASGFGVRGFYISTTPTVDMRNNIIVTTSTPTGTGLNCAYMRNSATLTTYSANSNNNCFYAGTPSASNLIYTDGTNVCQSLAAYKTLMAPRDAASIRELPPFANISTAPYDLHLTAGTETQCESGGTRITSPIAITDDYDANIRWGETGYSGTGTAPDIGADEGDFTPSAVMNYVSSTTTQVTGFAYSGALNQHIIRIEVVTTGASNPLTVDQIDVNANGTTNINDINGSTAKIYYTGVSSTFGTSILFGSATPTISNFSVTGTQTLSEGTNYFWLAYDISAGATSGNYIDGECVTINVGGTPQTPTVSAPAGNKTIVGPMSGTYYVGQGQTSPNFVTLTDAISNLTNRGVSGPVTFVLTNSSGVPYNAANGETFPLTLVTATGMSATNTVTIKPNSGVTPIISESSPSSIFKINQGDYFIIDGSNSGGTDRSLTIENTNAASTTSAVWFSSGSAIGTGATYNTIKNCNIKTGSNTLTTYAICISGVSIGASSGYDNDFNTIQNNYIYKAYYGIYAYGTSTATSNNLTVTGNTLGTPVGVTTDYIYAYGMRLYYFPNATISSNTFQNFGSGTTVYGMYIYYSNFATISSNTLQGFSTTAIYGMYIYLSTDATVSQNTLQNFTATSTLYGIYVYSSSTNAAVTQNTIQNLNTSGSTPMGIYIYSSSANANVNRNNINNVKYTGTGGYGGRGICVSGSNAVTLHNNIIYQIGGDGYTSFSGSSPVGIYLDGTITGANLYYNSVYMSGNVTYNALTITTAMYVAAATVTAIDMRDNIFQNSMQNTTNSTAKNYAIYSVATSTSYTTINYNDYYVSGTQGVLAYLGADITTLAGWQAATTQDANSQNVDPQFNSVTILQPTTTSPMLAAGTPIGAVTIDYLGVTRSGTNPTIGAYENGTDAFPPTITYTPLTNTTSTANRVLDNVTITDVGAGVDWANIPRIYYKKSTDANVFGGNTSGDNGWKWQVANVGSSPTSFNIDYSIIYGGSVAQGDFVQYFVVAQDMNATPNVTANPSTGFVGTSVSTITSAPTTPNQYKIVSGPMSGDYTVGLLMYNRLTGHNLTFEKRTRSVMKEVTYEEEIDNFVSSSKKENNLTDGKSGRNNENINSNTPSNSNNDVAENTAPTKTTITKTKMVEVIEEYSVLMENGREFKGDFQDGYDRGVYPTITEALTDVSDRGVSGPVRFLLNDATYPAESYPIIMNDINGASSTNTITLKPNSGVTSVITGTPGTAMFRLNGSDYFIFDGSNTLGGTTQDVTFQNNSTTTPIILMENGATNCVIKNCIFEGANTTSTSGTIALLSTSSVGNSFNTITNNRILDRSGIGSPYNAIYSSGLASAPNTNMTISSNEIANFTNNGIYVTATGNGSNWTISNNQFYNNMTPSTAQTSINFIPGAPSKSNTVSGNIIGGSTLNAGGTAWTNSGAVTFTGIIMAVDSVDGSTITNNTIKNVSLTSTGAANFYGLYVSLGFVTITGNTIGDESTANSVLNAGSAYTCGIYLVRGGSTLSILTRQDVINNTIANLSATGTGTGVRVRGVYQSEYTRLNISRNNIHHLSTMSTLTGLGGNAQTVVGIFAWQQTYLGIVIDSNTIHTITAGNTGAVATSSCCIFTSNFDGQITRNRMYNIINNSTGVTLTTPPIAAGVLMRWSNNGVISNNMISLGNGAADNVQFDGIIQVSNYTSANYTLFVYYNTITIQGTATTGTHRCYGFVIGDNTGTVAILTTPTIRNNIFDNQRTGGTGLYYAIGYQVLSTGWLANSSNYNCLNSSSASTVGYWNNADQTFASWKTVSNGDGYSMTAEPVTYADASTGNLHLNMGLTGTALESGGTVITGLTVDIDNDTRPGPIGSVNGGAFAPDLGADEFDGVFKDIIPPTITYTPLTNQTSTTTQTFDNVTITDISGVNTSSGTRPRCYYKRSTDLNEWNDNTSLTDGWKWVEANGTTSPFDFTIDYSMLNGGTGVTTGTVIQYFAVAQDLIVPPNVGINSGTFAAQPTSVNLRTSQFPLTGTINSYTIVAPPLSGTYTIGLTMFNRVTGKNLYYQTEKVKVTIPVLVDESVTNVDSRIENNSEKSISDSRINSTNNEKTEADINKVYRTEYREVEQERNVLYENGKPYKGSLRKSDFRLSSTKNFGDGPDLGDYATITAAITDLNSRGVSGPVTFVLIDATYSEAGTVTFSNVAGASSTNTITLKPNTGLSPVISGNFATPIFDLSGCQYVTIDGSNNGTSTKDLTISNTNTSGATLRFINDASNNTIKNTILNGVITTTTSGIVHFSTTTGTTGCDNNTLTNCTITAGATSPANGIYILGTSGLNGDNNNITNNIITNFGTYGIGLDNYYNNTTISGNEIYEAIPQTSTAITGIYVNYGMLTTNITGNKIHDLNTSGATPTLKGIYYANATSGDVINIHNNVIYLDGTTTNQGTIYGVDNWANGGTNCNIRNNSIYIGGTGVTVSSNSMGIYDHYGHNSTYLNNVVFNGRSNSTGSGIHYAVYVSSTPTLTSNYNNFFVNGTGGVFGYYNTANVATLAAWRTASSNDAYSITGDPGFTSTTNLQPDVNNPLCWNINGKGMPTALVTNDINGNPRSQQVSTGATDIGAYEFTPSVDPNDASQTGTIADGNTTTYTVAGNVVVSITWHTAFGTLPSSVSVKYRSGENPSGTPIGTNFGNFNTVITPTGGSVGFAYDMVYYYTPALIGSVSSEDNLRFAKYDVATGWDQWDVLPNTTTKTVSVTNLGSFSTFAFGDNSSPLPLQMKSFTSNVSGRNVNLAWTTEKEHNNKGFEVQRSKQNENNFVSIGFVNSKGNSNTPSNYTFEDKKLNAGKYNYRLKQVDLNGHANIFNLNNFVEIALPKEFRLSQNYPNPFNPATKIDFELPFDSRVRIVVYDMLGREVKILVNSETKQAGFYTVDLNAVNLASGTYFYRMIANSQGKDNIFTKKMTIVK